jgi:hypothetical protein
MKRKPKRGGQAYQILKALYDELSQLTPLDIFKMTQCLSAQQRIWELRTKYGLLIDNKRKGNGHSIWMLRQTKSNIAKAGRLLK